MSTQVLQVKTGDFEGPIELLLTLIEKRKMLINDVALVDVTDEFLNLISSMRVPLHQSTHFISVAATLILIKSKSLLPELFLTQEEEQGVVELQRRLELLAFLKEFSVQLNAHLESSQTCYSRRSIARKTVFNPGSMNREMVFQSIQKLLTELPIPEKQQKKMKNTINIQEVVQRIQNKLAGKRSFNFSSHVEHHKRLASTAPTAHERKFHRVHVVVNFLGLLELIRNQFLLVSQTQNYESIQVFEESRDLSNVV